MVTSLGFIPAALMVTEAASGGPPDAGAGDGAATDEGDGDATAEGDEVLEPHPLMSRAMTQFTTREIVFPLR